MLDPKIMSKSVASAIFVLPWLKDDQGRPSPDGAKSLLLLTYALVLVGGSFFLLWVA